MNKNMNKRKLYLISEQQFNTKPVDLNSQSPKIHLKSRLNFSNFLFNQKKLFDLCLIIVGFVHNLINLPLRK